MHRHFAGLSQANILHERSGTTRQGPQQPRLLASSRAQVTPSQQAAPATAAGPPRAETDSSTAPHGADSHSAARQQPAGRELEAIPGPARKRHPATDSGELQRPHRAYLQRAWHLTHELMRRM